MSALRFSMNGQIYDVTIVARRPELVLDIGGRHYRALENVDGSIEIDGQVLAFERAMDGDVAHLCMAGQTTKVAYLDPAAGAADEAHGADAIRATMPGTVVQVHAQAGDKVSAGDVVVTIESMKLQSRMTAARDGVVGEILKAEGETFDKGEALAVLVTKDDD